MVTGHEVILCAWGDISNAAAGLLLVCEFFEKLVFRCIIIKCIDHPNNAYFVFKFNPFKGHMLLLCF